MLLPITRGRWAGYQERQKKSVRTWPKLLSEVVRTPVHPYMCVLCVCGHSVNDEPTRVGRGGVPRAPLLLLTVFLPAARPARLEPNGIVSAARR